MLIPADRLVQLLASTERTLHSGGWSNPALLAEVTLTPQGLQATRLPMELLPPLVTNLEYLAETVEEKPELISKIATLGNLQALILAHESWSHPASAEEQWELTDYGNISLSEIKGSFQARQLILIDLHGRVVLMHRTHGRGPHYAARAAREWRHPHLLIHCLARVVRAIAGHKHPSQCDLTALNLLIKNAEDPRLRSPLTG